MEVSTCCQPLVHTVLAHVQFLGRTACQNQLIMEIQCRAPRRQIFCPPNIDRKCARTCGRGLNKQKFCGAHAKKTLAVLAHLGSQQYKSYRVWRNNIEKQDDSPSIEHLYNNQWQKNFILLMSFVITSFYQEAHYHIFLKCTKLEILVICLPSLQGWKLKDEPLL